jgi:uncharacterized protein YndB with AHSA1/START domain
MSVTSTNERPVAVEADGWPSFPELEDRAVFPALHGTSAFPIVRDRWERLVTTAVLPEPVARVSEAVVEPDALVNWLALCRGRLDAAGTETMLDFEDGEFFLCRTMYAGEAKDDPRAYMLRYVWRWLGVGQPATVTWRIAPADAGTSVTVTEEAMNPPGDWQTWNGGGWPGILNQLGSYLRTGTSWRWPWRRMGPYVQIELPLSPFEAWNALLSPAALQYWLQRRDGTAAPGETLSLVMGDASGTIELRVRELAEPGQRFPSFLPSMSFELGRSVWGTGVGGFLWIEPAGLGRSLLQVFHDNWENLPAELQLSERKLVAGFWTGAFVRAAQMFAPRPTGGSGHSWS